MTQNAPTPIAPMPALASHFLSLLPNPTLLPSSALLPLLSTPLPQAPASAAPSTSSKKSIPPGKPKPKAILPMPTPGCFLPPHLTTLLQPKPQIDTKPPRKVPIKSETVSIDGCVFNNRGYEICGHLNQHNKPCQRIGKCPFHSHIVKKESSEATEATSVETEKKEKPAPPMQKTPYKQGWTKEEHMRFLNGLHIHGKGAWKEIANVVGTRTPTQIQSHAQKYFLRQQQKVKNKRSIHDTSLEDVYSDTIRIVSPTQSPSPTPSPLSSPVKNGVPTNNLLFSSLPGFLTSIPFTDAFSIMYPPLYPIPYQLLPNNLPKYINLPEGLPVGYLTPFGFSPELTEMYKTMSTTTTTTTSSPQLTSYSLSDLRNESEDIQVLESDSLQSPPGYISQLMLSALPEDDDSKDLDDIMDLRPCKRSFEMLFDEQPSSSRPEKVLKLASTHDISSYINIL